jgi:predicted transcriptional regulator
MNILTETVLIKRWILILKSMIASLAPTMSLRKKANLSTTQASEMMEISRSLLSKLEHGKNMSTEKLADIIAYYIAFIEENSEVKISCREILNEIIMQASPFS